MATMIKASQLVSAVRGGFNRGTRQTFAEAALQAAEGTPRIVTAAAAYEKAMRPAKAGKVEAIEAIKAGAAYAGRDAAGAALADAGFERDADRVNEHYEMAIAARRAAYAASAEGKAAAARRAEAEAEAAAKAAEAEAAAKAEAEAAAKAKPAKGAKGAAQSGAAVG